MAHRFSAFLTGFAAVAVASQALAQGAPPASAPGANAPAGDGAPITVTGTKMPQAEAPKSATCEQLVQNDPTLKAQLQAGGSEPLMGPRITLPTRAPRNPDYNAPPLSPPGSPLPTLSTTRFGVSGPLALPGQTNAGASSLTAGNDATDQPAAGEYSDEQAIAACRGMYSRGGSAGGAAGHAGSSTDILPSSMPEPAMAGQAGVDNSRLIALNGRYDAARAEIARSDTTLPMAFALFDQRRFAESLTWFQKAYSRLKPEEGGNEAALFIGKLYMFGLGDKSDSVQGLKWLKTAANAPFNPTTDIPAVNPRRPELNTASGEAAVILGNLYRIGYKGVPKDLQESRKWFERAYEVGHVPAAKTIGDFYYHGDGVPRDVKKAMTYYQKAAEFGFADAAFSLAEIYYHGAEGVQPDVKRALQWYQVAAKMDHPGALYALARAYDKGEGVAADPAMALGFYKTAALKGDGAAMAALGSYFYEGKQVPANPTTARDWFGQAALRGDPIGMLNLAAMMVRGEGGPKDLVDAWVWMRRAASLGDDDAASDLPVLERQMSAAEKQKAAALLVKG